MAKKILIISSTPRRGGNSETLCDQFAQGAENAGHETEKLILAEKNIGYCTGCGICFDRNNSCSQNDDMGEIIEKMIAAEVIVLATPVYFYTMCGQMKTFIDRVCAGYTKIFAKEFYFIATAAVGNKQALDRTFEEFRGFTSCLDDPVEKGVVYGVGVWNIGDIKETAAMKEAYDMGMSV